MNDFHYCQWIPNFYEEIHPLTEVCNFPLNAKQADTFHLLKREIAGCCKLLPTPRDDLEYAITVFHM